MIAVRCRMDPSELGPGSAMRELYDLEADPKEGRNLLAVGSDADCTQADELEAALNGWIDECVAARATD